MYPKEIIEELKSLVKLSDVIGQYIELKQRGSSFVGVCPFHPDKDPSLSVSDDKKFYHCFGCKASGDVFRFLVEYKNITFPESIEEVAKMVGFPLERYKISNPEADKRLKERERIFSVNDLAARVYHDNLLKDPFSDNARKYLADRKISQEMVQKFKIGYAPDDWDFLANILGRKKYSPETMMMTQLIRQGKAGKLYDLFRDRIIFPIWDEQNRLIAFGGRIIENKEREAKYINLPETQLFYKSRELYGLNFARNSIKEKNTAILVEGYFDVVAAFQFGIENVVAALGTGITIKHLQKLRSYCSRIIFIFDPDAAGKQATNRAIINSLKTDIEVFILSLPEGKDPYDYLFEYGADSFLSLIENNKVNMMEFKINDLLTQYDVNIPQSRLKFFNEFFSFLSQIDSTLFDLGIQLVSSRINIFEKDIREAFQRYQRNKKPSYSDMKKPADQVKDEAENIMDSSYTFKKVEHSFFMYLIHNPDYIPKYLGQLKKEHLHDNISRRFYDVFQSEYEKYLENNAGYENSNEKYPTSPSLDTIATQIPDENNREAFLEEVMANSQLYEKAPEKALQENLQKIKYNFNKRQIDEIQRKISKLPSDSEELKNLLEEKIYLVNELKKYSGRS